MAQFSRKTFENFLGGIKLASCRDLYARVKIVEMDLPDNIQALQTIYEQYWENVDGRPYPPSFDEYYEIYWQRHKTDIKKFWRQSGFGLHCPCFKRGLKARTYRTWASLLTQIQGAYVAQSVFGRYSVKMSAELDRQGTDILIVNQDGAPRFRLQIKKETHRREIARMQKEKLNNDTIYLYYRLPSDSDYIDPYYKKNGKEYHKNDLKPFTRDFVKWYPKTATLDRLQNGFVIFSDNAFRFLTDSPL